MIHGGKDAVGALIEHPGTDAISFVGSTAPSRYIYAKAGEHGKRVQCQGGANNIAVIDENAEIDIAAETIADAAYGCAGQRCLAKILVVTVGGARTMFTEAMVEATQRFRVGYGLDEESQMGPVSKAFIEQTVGLSQQEGRRLLVDGCGKCVDGFEDGNWIFPTLVDEVQPNSTLATHEVFGPVLGSCTRIILTKPLN